MFLVYLALLHVVGCFDLQIEGDVSFDVRVSNWQKGKQQWFRQRWDDGYQKKNELVFKMMQVRRNMTVAPEVECVYQYPEKEQMDSMLSHMMNELTKVFVRANDFINGVETRREMDRDEATFRPDDSRFHVVYKKQKQFFEKIYNNMTQEYRNFYNTTVERVDRTDRDPCQHQDEVKQIWRDLLTHSLKTLKKAAQQCVQEYLADQNINSNSRIGKRLDQFLTKELRKMRSNQLNMLCDTYQLCYNDLLK